MRWTYVVCHTEKTLSNFKEIWSKCARTILQYSMPHSFCSKDIKEALLPLLDDDLLDNQKGYEFGTLMEFCVVWLHQFLLLHCR